MSEKLELKKKNIQEAIGNIKKKQETLELQLKVHENNLARVEEKLAKL